MPTTAPLIIGLGGANRGGSTSERVLVKALEAAERAGARTRLFGGQFLARLPIFDPAAGETSDELAELLEGVRAADGVLIASPGYHGSISGLIKNALDSLEGLRDDVRPYFEGRAVGCLVTADGWQAGGTTLSAMRTTIHALRGWPTPLGVAFNPAAAPLFDAAGALASARDQAQIEMLAAQVVGFARRWSGDFGEADRRPQG